MRKPASFIIFLLLAIVFLIVLTPKVLHVRSLGQRSDRLAEEIKKLELQNQLLERELRLLREDPVYLEKVAREKFNKAKEGEIVYRVVREVDTAPSS
ncbi:MAG: septum formation initiator family protein [Candidatus Omnitrophica bacterium]|nr:septum formation initiator family protein [Candidatus Omnitrophota bacterium]